MAARLIHALAASVLVLLSLNTVGVTFFQPAKIRL